MTESDATIVVHTASRDVVVVAEPGGKPAVTLSSGAPGPKGAPGTPASISADPGNRLAEGSDGGLLCAQWVGADPLAYYILAKS